MGFGYKSGMALHDSSPVRTTQPVQRQQSHDLPHSDETVPSQCSDAIASQNWSQKLKKDLANQSRQKVDTEFSLDGFSSEKFLQEDGLGCGLKDFGNTQIQPEWKVKLPDNKEKATEEEEKREENLKQEESRDNKLDEGNCRQDSLEECEPKQEASFPFPKNPEDPKKTEEDKWKNEAEDTENWMEKMEEVELESKPDGDRTDETKEEIWKEVTKEVEPQELGSSAMDGKKQLDSLEEEEVMEKWQPEDEEDAKKNKEEHHKEGQKLRTDGQGNEIQTEQEQGGKNGKTPWKELADMRKAAKMQQFPGTDVSILQKGSHKVKKAANENSGKEGDKNDGQANQDRSGNCQATDRFNGVTKKPADGNGDDGDGGRKRNPVDLKERLDCDRPAQENKKQTKKKKASSPSSEASIAEELNWEKTGARPKMTPGVAGGDADVIRRGMLNLSLLTDTTQATGGPAGDARPGNRHDIAAHPSLTPLPVTRLPYTLHNVQAAKRLYHDDGVKAPHKVYTGGALSVPPGVYAGGSKAARGSSKSVEEPEPTEVGSEADVPRSPVPEVPPSHEVPHEVPHEDPAPPGVHYGEPRDVDTFVGQLQQLKICSNEQLEGQHQGVLSDRDLRIESDEYIKGKQHTRVSCLGRGSFGDVYLHRDRKSGMRFVVKQVPLEKFAANEALVSSGLDHPNIMRLKGLVLTNEMVMFLSEYHEDSQTLQQCVDKAVFGQGRALRLINQLFIALEFLHGEHIVHKDIKPDNILILPGDRIKLIDFGLAMRLSTPEHTDEALKGTECYMAPEIAGGGLHDDRVDVWSGTCAFICLISGHPPWAQRFKGIPTKIFLIAVKNAPLEDIPKNTDPRVRQFIEQCLIKDFHQRPSAARVLEILPRQIVDELYSTLAVPEGQVTEAEPMESVGIPDNVLAGPLTPWTPRGPEDRFPPFQPAQHNRRDNTPISDMSLSVFYIPSDNEPANNGRCVEMDVVGAEEDMYGPPMEADGPEVFNEVFQRGDAAGGGLGGLPVRHSSASSVSGGSMARLRSRGAPNFGQPEASSRINAMSQQAVGPEAMDSVNKASQNSQAALSFIQDEPAGNAANPSGRSGWNCNSQNASQSFELKLEGSQDSSMECNSWSTAYAQIVDASKMPSAEGAHHHDEPDYGGAAVGKAMTSGFDSNSPRDSAEESKGQQFECQAETVGRTDNIPSVGIVVTINIEGVEPLKLRIPPDLTVKNLAKQIVHLPNCVNSKIMTKTFTLALKETGQALDLNHTFSCGEHELVAVLVPDGGDWLWHIDGSGEITSTSVHG